MPLSRKAFAKFATADLACSFSVMFILNSARLVQHSGPLGGVKYRCSRMQSANSSRGSATLGNYWRKGLSAAQADYLQGQASLMAITT